MATVSNAEVVLLGMGTVFFGLICIVLLVKLTSYIVRKSDAKNAVSASGNAAPAPAAAPAAPQISEQAKGEIAAAVSVAIAESLGTDVSGIRIVSLKKIS